MKLSIRVWPYLAAVCLSFVGACAMRGCAGVLV